MVNNKIEKYYEPLEILNRLSSRGTEMSVDQLGFLCGLIRKYKPMKIVEIGVAGGGTTAVILNCVSQLGINSKIFSIDVALKYYRDSSKQVGYLIEECRELLQQEIDHTLYIGQFAPECLESIGKDIDMLILDTVHRLPGELLDFLACYPFLKKGSIVVLHDITLNHYSGSGHSFATKLLLDTVVAEKIFNVNLDNPLTSIGAFVINDDTDKYISDVFSALTITWAYRPANAELALYKEFYSKYYSNDKLLLFDVAIQLNLKTLSEQYEMRVRGIKNLYALLETVKLKNVYIYGYGKFGKYLGALLKKCGAQFEGYIISDGQSIEDSNEKVYFLSELCINKEKDIIVGAAIYLQKEICKELEKMGIREYIFADASIYQLQF